MGHLAKTPIHLVDHSLLRPHVRLRDADFVHELAKSYCVVTGELPQDLSWASVGKTGQLWVGLTESSTEADTLPCVK